MLYAVLYFEYFSYISLDHHKGLLIICLGAQFFGFSTPF
uniref:Uncharacterized protein n=1 Tax=Anguilla anguilla TaxID=7936 RepID=A0A0E9VK75_ANGAN